VVYFRRQRYRRRRRRQQGNSAFTAINPQSTPIDVIIKYKVETNSAYAICGPDSGSFTIRVTPKTNIDLDLVADPVPGQIVCVSANFTEITFSAKDRGTSVAASYRVEFVSGDILDNDTLGLLSSNAWVLQATRVGKGVCRVVPLYK
jgi:hypothetical protein